MPPHRLAPAARRQEARAARSIAPEPNVHALFTENMDGTLTATLTVNDRVQSLRIRDGHHTAMASYTPRARPSMRNLSSSTFTASTPTTRRASDMGSSTQDLRVGDTVDVPGGMDGIVKFVGEVRGKQGHFVGVELNRRWANRGKNDGDAEGVKYFTTSVPGAGIFLPISRATKRASLTESPASIPATPTDVHDVTISPNTNGTSTRTPPTPSIAPRFSQSVGPGRAPSPAFRPRSRPSLPRPESPLRRTQNASTATPLTNRPSLNMLSHNRLAGPRLNAPSPTPGKMAGRTPKTSNGYPSPAPTRTNGRLAVPRDDSDEIAQLRAVIQEKNEKIAVLTAEFDSHRSDFRSTLDTLELASTETERVYERRVEELLEERRNLMAQSEDVESVAHQLRQLEEVVQELEEGLEDARRGEAEARGEVEFLRGEVERVRAELRREREHNQELERERSRAVKKETKHDVEREGETDHGGEMEENEDFDKQLAHEEEKGSDRDVNGTQHPPPPAAGSVDADKWCALCEGDGHDSISCPFEK
ncbi:hypothetical protein MMC11_000215 [Xylographa trunciseda]|nr:hypothetical protein [Xylographa trunciseda]